MHMRIHGRLVLNKGDKMYSANMGGSSVRHSVAAATPDYSQIFLVNIVDRKHNIYHII